MKKVKKHAAPFWCRLKVRLRKARAIDFAVCDMGAGSCGQCAECVYYKPDRIRDSCIEASSRLLEQCKELQKTFDAIKFSLSLPMPPPTDETHKEEEESEDTE